MGNTSVVVSLLSGSLARDVIVSLRSLNSTAMGKFPYELTISRYLCAFVGIQWLYYLMFSFNPAGMDFPDTSTDLTFNATSTTQTVMVSILNDVVPEDMLEYFSLILTSTDPAVTLNPMTANVTIIDDMDSKYHLTSAVSYLHTHILYTVLVCMYQIYFLLICSGYNWV